MISYKHTQVGYLMIVVTLAVLIFFVWLHITASAGPDSIDSGTNFAISAIMVFVLFILATFITLTTSVDEHTLRIKFGYGLFAKKFLLDQIASVQSVKNRWYYGWGIKVWFWPKMWVYAISGFDAVEIIMKNGKRYRIGTDVPSELEAAIKQAIQ